MERLPEEMVTNILSRLAVKNILQIRCVCKSWNTIISHPKFSKSQLEQSNKNNKTVHNQNLLILSEILEPISISSSDYEDGNEDCKFTSSRLNFPVKHHEDIVVLSRGSCNGLLCFEVGFEIVIWNPSIRQYKILPENGFGFGPSLTHGFGYDSLSDDYKVVGATVHGGNNVVVVNVFSLKTNSWRSFEDPSYGNFAFIYGNARNFLNGSLHWFVVEKLGRDRDRGRDGNVVFVAFSLAEEKFLEVPLPDAVDAVDLGETCVFDGCLCLSRLDKVKCGVEIWVMKEYMVKASWTKLFKVLWLPSPEFRAFCLPLYTSRDGDIILELNKRCVLKFNIKEKTFKTVIELEENDSLQVIGYVESLVSPNFDDVQRQLL